MEEIDSAVGQALADERVRVILFRGAGEKAFVAGADISEMTALSPTQAQEFSRFLQRVLSTIERSAKPTIPVIQGFALGGGCELAMACHLRFASDRALLGQPEVALGLIPGAGGTQRLPRLIGRGRALDLILSGRMVKADEALRIGLVDRVCPPDSLEETVQEYAVELMRKSPIAQARSLEAVISGSETSQSEAMRLESSLFGLSFSTEDMREGTAAFTEKRRPDFKGC
jgi:enoyl-CoA hydratase